MFLRSLAILLLSLAFGCSHEAVEKDISQKMNRESDVTSQDDLTSKANLVVQNAKGISNDQRRRLMELRSATTMQLEINWQQQLKLKSVLIKEVIQTDYKENEVELIKSKLKDLESKRLAIMFSSVDEANRIMGREARVNDDVMKDFVRIEHD